MGTKGPEGIGTTNLAAHKPRWHAQTDAEC